MALVTLYLPWCGPSQLAADNLGVQLLQSVAAVTDSAPAGSVNYVSVTCPGGGLTTRRRLLHNATARALQAPSPGAYPQGLTYDAAGRFTTSGAVNTAIDLASPSFVVLRLTGIQNIWSSAQDVIANSPLAPPTFSRAKVLPSWYFPGPLDPAYQPGSSDLLAANTAASMIAEALGTALGCPGASFQLGAAAPQPLQSFAAVFLALTGTTAPPFVCVGGALSVGIGQPTFFALPPGPASAAAAAAAAAAASAAAAAALAAQQELGLSVGLGGGVGLLLLGLLAFYAFWLLKRREKLAKGGAGLELSAKAVEASMAAAVQSELAKLRTNPLHLDAESGRELKRKKAGGSSGSPRYIIPPESLSSTGLSRALQQRAAAAPQPGSELALWEAGSPRTQRSVSFRDYANPFPQTQTQAQAQAQLQLLGTLQSQQQSQQLLLQQQQTQQQHLQQQLSETQRQLQLQLQLQKSQQQPQQPQQPQPQQRQSSSPPTHQRFHRPGIIDQQPFMPSAVSPLSPPMAPPPLSGPPMLRVPPSPF